MSEIYRGYNIEPAKAGGFDIKKDDKVVSNQSSVDDAYAWVDAERRKAIRDTGK